MYRIGQRKRSTKHHLYVLLGLFFLVVAIGSLGYVFLTSQSSDTAIKQTKASSEVFDPNNTKGNLKISTPLYTMELPHDWKQIAENEDTRYNSIKWQMQSGIKNRWLELYTDRVPTDIAVNRIIPISITATNDHIITELVSDNCAKFTTLVGASLKVPSKWDDAPFLCDMSNKTDNIIGISEKNTGTTFTLTGKLNGKHTYMFIYTDRGIPEDENPITTALGSIAPK